MEKNEGVKLPVVWHLQGQELFNSRHSNSTGKRFTNEDVRFGAKELLAVGTPA